MSKRKKRSRHHSASTARLLQRLVPERQPSRHVSVSRQRATEKSTTPERRVRIVLFSSWGTDYNQSDYSVAKFWGLVFGVIFILGALTIFTSYSISRVVQNCRLSLLNEKQQTLRNRLSQAEVRVRNAARRFYNLNAGMGGILAENEELNELPAFDPNNEKDDRESTGYVFADVPEAPVLDNDADSSLFHGQGGGAYIDEEDNIYPSLFEKERTNPGSASAKEGQGHTARAGSIGGSDLLSQLEKRLSQRQVLQKTIIEKFEIRRKQLEHIPTIKPLLSGRITDLFGKRRDPFVTRIRHHQGLDIAAPRGTEVFAPANGIVELVKTTYRVNRGYGKAVVINHGYGIKTLYGHLAEIKVTPGQRIERWDLIGLVGETGRATGPHLHYEVWLDGQATDPIRFILND